MKFLILIMLSSVSIASEVRVLDYFKEIDIYKKATIYFDNKSSIPRSSNLEYIEKTLRSGFERKIEISSKIVINDLVGWLSEKSDEKEEIGHPIGFIEILYENENKAMYFFDATSIYDSNGIFIKNLNENFWLQVPNYEAWINKK